jgi:hypothetical protein
MPPPAARLQAKKLAVLMQLIKGEADFSCKSLLHLDADAAEQTAGSGFTSSADGNHRLHVVP